MSVRLSSRSASSDLCRLGEQAIEQGRSVRQLADAMGIRLTEYRALPDMPPLCFLHIPKTAGAAVTAWLKSMFLPEEIAPYATEGEFEELPHDSRQYRLYAGHITGGLMRYLPCQTQFATINRDPVERSVSEYYWALDHYPQILAENPELWDEPDGIAETLKFFRKVDLYTALSTEHFYFRDRVLRQIGDLGNEDDTELDNASPILRGLRERRWQRSVELLSAFSVVGDYGDIEGATLLLAAMRGWPAPPRLPRIHDVGAPTARLAADQSIREIVRAVNIGDFWLYGLTRARAASVRVTLQALCGAATSEAVDRHHTQHFFATANRVVAVDLEPDAPRSGAGWDIVQRDGHGRPFREMHPGRPVSTLALLDPSIGDYRVFGQVFHCSSGDVVDSLIVKVAGMPLARAGTVWRQWANGSTLVVEWQLPQDLVVKVEGRVELAFEADLLATGSALWLGRIGCVPGAFAAG